MASQLYNSFKRDIMNGSIDLDTDTIKIALCSSSYTPDIDSHTKFSDITNEISAAGYTAGGASLANKAVAVDNTNNRAYFDADDVSWSPGATFTVRYAILYKSTGTPSTSNLIGYIDFTTDRTAPSGDTFLINFTAPGDGGILYLS
jgi:hypothetical protein